VTREHDDIDGNGHVAIPVPEHPIVWTTKPLGDERHALRDVATRTIRLQLLRDGKASTREGASAAAKDRADYAALARLGADRP
jgi:hypothetical protein